MFNDDKTVVTIGKDKYIDSHFVWGLIFMAIGFGVVIGHALL